MKKHIKSIFIILVTVICLTFSAINAFAVTPIDPERDASLTLFYSHESSPIDSLLIKTYYVANVSPDGTYNLTMPFNTYPVNIYGITSQAEWKEVASTISQYIIANNVTPTYSAQTDAEGKVVFADIKPGMYLTLSVSENLSDVIVTYDSFISIVPIPHSYGEHEYNVIARPKYETIKPTPEKEPYRIIKQWKDAGFEENRPSNVDVDIYRNGTLFYSAKLNSSNNWSYSWEWEKDGSRWTVVERDVPIEYNVTVTRNAETFIITNIFDGDEPTPGDPKDKGISVYFVLVFLSGISLVSISLKLKR